MASCDRHCHQLATALCLFITLALPSTTGAQSSQPAVRVDWDPRPSLRFGDVGRIDFRLKLQADVRGFNPEQDTDEGTFELQRRRAGVAGEFFGRVEFEIERELRERGPWRDVYVDVQASNALEVKAGKFKIPFGLEQTTGTMDQDFIFRTLASTTIAPARDVGVMAHGRFTRAFEYEAGLFRDDGENARLTEPVFLLPGEPEPEGGRVFATRVVTTPVPRGRNNERLRVGVAFTSANLPEGLNSLRGRTVFGSAFFPRVYVRGRRTRMGIEAEWNPGRFGFRSEYMRALDERQGQGLGDIDLSTLITRGWYASATWIVTGERKGGGVNPDDPLFRGGVGAIELASRIETLAFGSASHEGPAFTNPRAEHIAENRDTIWTTGVNWYVNRWVKLQANAIRERIEDPERTPVSGRQVFWSGVFRMQLVL